MASYEPIMEGCLENRDHVRMHRERMRAQGLARVEVTLGRDTVRVLGNLAWRDGLTRQQVIARILADGVERERAAVAAGGNHDR